MSVRGYKVIKIEREKTPSFSLWNDYDVIKLLSEYNLITDQTDEAGGLIELRCLEFQDWYKNEWQKIKDGNIARMAIVGDLDAIKEFVKQAEAVFIQLLQDSKDEEFIYYYCY